MNRRLWLTGGLAAAAAQLSGCAAPRIEDFEGERPLLDLSRYFQGTVDAWGVFTDRSGQVVKRFTVVMRCQWTGDQGVLDEDFTYSDGSTQKRIWQLQRQEGGRYSGRADDVIGTAQGQTRGNAFHWTYTLALPWNDTTLHVQMDDWMFLMSDAVLLNRATMSKWGVRLGEVLLSFHKRAAG